MTPTEMAAHAVKKARQKADKARLPDFSKFELDAPFSFPKLPSAATAPQVLREALRRDADDIMAGRWKAFGHMDLQVENPPRWHKDYLVGKDFESGKSAFELDHRKQPDGADIKIIWEPSRWYQLVRLAAASHVLGDEKAGETCLMWLADWVEHNKPFTGLNWTSGLETGMRLMQFVWIDAMLAHNPAFAGKLSALRKAILPAHVWYTWRYQSFGSSANNHLLGELVGLVLALARWPSLERISAPLGDVQKLFERETLLQFAADGGNREQALGYHLFSWEFCWQAWQALKAAGKLVSAEVEARIVEGARFYSEVKMPGDGWDFGDSDNAFVTPLFLDQRNAADEWREWMTASEKSPGLRYWWGTLPGAPREAGNWWKIFPHSGYALQKGMAFSLRLDASPLGFLATAAHGHLDALHLSVWYRGAALVVDPGTGAYYSDKTVRDYFASWQAHNGPTPVGLDFPVRFGTFLWGKPHAVPTIEQQGGVGAVTGTFESPMGTLTRVVRVSNTIEVEDSFAPSGAEKDFHVFWKFAPGTKLVKVGEKHFIVETASGRVALKLTDSWTVVEFFSPTAEQARANGFALEALGNTPLQAVCSPNFRRLTAGPYLSLKGTAGWKYRCVFSGE